VTTGLRYVPLPFSQSIGWPKEKIMYSMVRNLRGASAITREAASFAVAFVFAEFFYKFHSFSLECLAFLLTWTVLSGLTDLCSRLFGRANPPSEES
jgi:hypothetical protein